LCGVNGLAPTLKSSPIRVTVAASAADDFSFEDDMRDVLYLLLTAACFGLMALYVWGCQALGERDTSNGDRS
jgi:hypothetical protein